MYEDNQSGPVSGGEGGNGTYLNIYGLNFGSSQGSSTVTINGTAAAQYLYWGADPTGERQRIGIQVASGTTTGSIVVTTSGGSCTAGTFTVRSGHIYYFGSAIDNGTPGNCTALLGSNSYSSPAGFTNSAVPDSSGQYSNYKTPETYYQCFSPGDTGVFLNGANYELYDGRGFHSSFTTGDITATSSQPITFMVRPGSTAQIGGVASDSNGVGGTGPSAAYNNFYGFTMEGVNGNARTAIYAWDYNRVIGNTLLCPACNLSVGGGLESGDPGGTGSATGIVALGNNILNISSATSGGPVKTFHCVYLYGNSFEFGWNKISGGPCYNGLQVNLDSSAGSWGFNIHDNDIADVNGCGLNMATIDPEYGAIYIYNNVIHHTGIALANGESSDSPHCGISVKGSGTGTGAGTLHIWNNTLFDTAGILNTAASGENESGCYMFVNSQTNVTIDLQDNVCVQPTYTYTANYNVYFAADGSNSPSITGGHNSFYSVTTPASTTPASTYGTIGNPTLVNITPCSPGCSYTNYEPQSSSSLIGAGVSLGPVPVLGGTSTYLTWDFNQAVRANPPAIGAFEYASGVAPPTSLFGTYISGGSIK